MVRESSCALGPRVGLRWHRIRGQSRPRSAKPRPPAAPDSFPLPALLFRALIDILSREPAGEVLEEGLLEFGGCAVVISHDRWFLDRVATHILAFEGESSVHWFAGDYSAYLADYRRRRGREAGRCCRPTRRPPGQGRWGRWAERRSRRRTSLRSDRSCRS